MLVYQRVPQKFHGNELSIIIFPVELTINISEQPIRPSLAAPNLLGIPASCQFFQGSGTSLAKHDQGWSWPSIFPNVFGPPLHLRRLRPIKSHKIR
jgi:hypothetical protein